MVLAGERTIVHMDLDTFFVSVERLLNSKLNGKPILIGGTSDRGVVASCSYEARQFGVHSAMPMKMARILCPEAVIVKGDFDQYSKHSEIVTDIIREKAPLFEKASIDEHYLDITGMDKYFGCLKWTTELRDAIIKNSGLPVSFGMSTNKTVSKVATGVSKPNGQLEIKLGGEKGFLAPLSIRRIPMLGPRAFDMLKNMGVTKILTLQEMPVELIQKVLGENGVTIWKKANGIDNTPVVPYSNRKSISTETTFQQDTTDSKKMNEVLVRMVEELAFKLRSQGKLTSCVVVKLRYSNFETYTMQTRISHTSADHLLIQPVRELFQKLYTRRILVRLLGVKFTNLVHGHYQINLFDDAKEAIDLYEAIDKMKNKYGEQSIIRCSGF